MIHEHDDSELTPIITVNYNYFILHWSILKCFSCLVSSDVKSDCALIIIFDVGNQMMEFIYSVISQSTTSTVIYIYILDSNFFICYL